MFLIVVTPSPVLLSLLRRPDVGLGVYDLHLFDKGGLPRLPTAQEQDLHPTFHFLLLIRDLLLNQFVNSDKILVGLHFFLFIKATAINHNINKTGS